MATLVQPAESTIAGTSETSSNKRLVTSNNLHAASRVLRTLLRTFAGALLLPLLLAVSLVVFLIALADFALFRLRDLRNGHPHPKGLWEF